MLDDPVPAPGARTSICPWCSATYAGEPDTCPSCGAALAVDPGVDPALPGLTAIDPEAILRAKAAVPKQRNRLLSWISGEYTEDVGTAAEEGALAPPPVEVRREMLRLALAAEVANLQAEADSYMADAVAEGPAVVGDASAAPGTETVPVADGGDAPAAAPPAEATPESAPPTTSEPAATSEPADDRGSVPG